MAEMKWYDTILYFVLVIGGLNWGLTLFNFNLVDWVFGVGSIGSMLVYGLVGISALYAPYIYFKLK